MEKPTPTYAHEATLDYIKCRDFIEDKYQIKTRDYAGKFGKDGVTDKPYLDFWHWLIGEYDYICNDSHFTLMPLEHLKDNRTPDWVKEILKLFVAEFPPDNGGINFHVRW